MDEVVIRLEAKTISCTRLGHSSDFPKLSACSAGRKYFEKLRYMRRVSQWGMLGTHGPLRRLGRGRRRPEAKTTSASDRDIVQTFRSYQHVRLGQGWNVMRREPRIGMLGTPGPSVEDEEEEDKESLEVTNNRLNPN